MIPALIALFQSHPVLPRLIAILVGAALFLAFYLLASWQRAHGIAAASSLPRHTEASTWLTIAALTAISFALTLLGGYGALVFFYYTSGYVGGSLPIRRIIPAAIVITLIALAGSWIAGTAWLDLVQTLIFIPAIIIITRTVMWSITTSWELHAAREEIARLAVTTERERNVLAAATQGASIAEIAASLFLSEGTVRNYLSVAIQKLGAHNRVEAAHIAEQKGWL
jgi:two-component system, NarL family, sensor histidine kinase DesK